MSIMCTNSLSSADFVSGLLSDQFAQYNTDEAPHLGRAGPNLEPGPMRVYVTNGLRNSLGIGRKVGPCPGSRRQWVLGSVRASSQAAHAPNTYRPRFRLGPDLPSLDCQYLTVTLSCVIIMFHQTHMREGFPPSERPCSVCGSPRLCRRRERRLIGARFGRWREERFGRARCLTLRYSLLLSVWVDSSVEQRGAYFYSTRLALPSWPIQDIISLVFVCARINHPFITPAHLHYPHYCNAYTRLLCNI